MDNNSEIENVMPHDAQAEQAVLGSIFLDENALAEAIEFVTPDDFKAGRFATSGMSMALLMQPQYYSN